MSKLPWCCHFVEVVVCLLCMLCSTYKGENSYLMSFRKYHDSFLWLIVGMCHLFSGDIRQFANATHLKLHLSACKQNCHKSVYLVPGQLQFCKILQFCKLHLLRHLGTLFPITADTLSATSLSACKTPFVYLIQARWLIFAAALHSQQGYLPDWQTSGCLY